MTLLFVEGFDDKHFAADADLAANGWEHLVGTAGVHQFFITNGGPFGTGCYQYLWATTESELAHYIIDKAGTNMPTNQLRIAFWVRVNNWVTSDLSGNDGLIILGNRTDRWWKMWFDSDGQIVMGYFDDTLLVGTRATGETCLNDGLWHHVEMNLIADLAAGTIEVWDNGVKIIDFTGDTSNAASGDVTSLDTVSLKLPRASGGAGSDIEFDDIVIWDDGGSDFTGQLGEHRVEGLVVNAAGTNTDFTPLASTNISQVDESGTPDGDTTYNSSNTALDTDTFGVDNLTFGTTIKGVSVKTYGRTDGSNTFQNVVRSSSVEANSATFTLTTSYDTYRHVQTLDPGAGTPAWTATTVNAMEIGYEVIS